MTLPEESGWESLKLPGPLIGYIAIIKRRLTVSISREVASTFEKSCRETADAITVQIEGKANTVSLLPLGYGP